MNWLKSLFNKRTSLTFTLEELKERAQQQLEQEQQHSSWAEIVAITTELRSSLEALKEASVQTKDNRLMQLVLGNRDAFVRQTLLFVDTLPEQLTASTFAETVSDIASRYETYVQKSLKSFHIASQLIGGPLEKPLLLVQKMNEHIQSLQQQAVRMKDIASLREEAEQLFQAVQRTGTVAQEQAALKSKQETGQRAVTDIQVKIDALRASASYQEYVRYQAELKSTQQALIQLQSNVKDAFSPVQKNLVKLQADAPAELLARYIHDPFVALLEDSELRIETHIREILASLDTTVQNEKKREKIGEAAALLSKAWFQDILQQHSLLVKKQRDLQTSVVDNTARKEEEALVNERQRIERSNAERDKSLQRFQTEPVTKETLQPLEQKASKLLDADVTLTLPLEK